MTMKPLEETIHRWPSASSKTWIVAFLERARLDPNMISVVAIGSSVRPGVVSEDLDVIVFCHDARALVEKAPMEIDLRKVNFDSVEDKLENGHDLVSWAVRFGEPLLDNGHAWKGIVQRWKSRLPLPDPKVSMGRAKAVRKRMEEMRDIGDENAFADLRVSYLTHRARACLAKAEVYPQSRPELPRQLRELGEIQLAEELEAILSERENGTTIGLGAEETA